MSKDKKADEKPEDVYIMYTGNIPDGVSLPGFESAEALPGRPLGVRGDDGINFDTALKLVLRGDFAWCNAEGQVIDDPEPTEEEQAVIDATGAAALPGRPHPAYHKRDENYAPSDMQGATEKTATPGDEEPGLPDVPRTVRVGRVGRTTKEDKVDTDTAPPTE